MLYLAWNGSKHRICLSTASLGLADAQGLFEKIYQVISLLRLSEDGWLRRQGCEALYFTILRGIARRMAYPGGHGRARRCRKQMPKRAFAGANQPLLEHSHPEESTNPCLNSRNGSTACVDGGGDTVPGGKREQNRRKQEICYTRGFKQDL